MATWRLVVIGFVFSMLGYIHVQSTGIDIESFRQPLTELNQLAEKENLAIHEWQVRMRDEQKESITKQEFISLAHLWTKQLSGWEKTSVSFEGTEWKAHFTYHNPALQTTESVQLFAYPSPHQGRYTYLITYGVIGTEASTLGLKELYDELDVRAQQLELKNPNLYVQVQATQQSEVAAQTSNLEYAEKWITSLGAETVEALDEGTFVSVSAYNPEWSQVLETNGKKMNVQVALRQEERLGARTTVTIGTPIITTEY